MTAFFHVYLSFFVERKVVLKTHGELMVLIQLLTGCFVVLHPCVAILSLSLSVSVMNSCHQWYQLMVGHLLYCSPLVISSDYDLQYTAEVSMLPHLLMTYTYAYLCLCRTVCSSIAGKKRGEPWTGFCLLLCKTT